MRIISSASSVQKLSEKLRSEGKRIGFVPTMGYLHEGHLSLMRKAAKHSDILFTSIYVNPLQFGPAEDYKRYPRDLKRDEQLCRREGVDYIFYPDDKEMYPDGYSTYVEVENITESLEGKIRPGHFKGVSTVVLKLFNIVKPHIAVFGQKDFQQCAVIKKMAADLNVDTKIIISDTVREDDGLAMSSRNKYLSPEQRNDAPVLYKALQYAKRKLEDVNYNRDIDFIKHQMSKLIRSKANVTKIDYISFNELDSLKEIDTVKILKKGFKIVVSMAVRFGNIRLIDNHIIKY